MNKKISFVLVFILLSGIFTVSCKQDIEEENNLFSIILTQNTTEETNSDVIVNIEILNCSFVRTVKYAAGSKSLNYFENNGITLNSVEGIYSFSVTENGTYTVFALGNDGRRETKEIVIKNIDRIPPAEISNLQIQYDYDSKTITVSWQNPIDEDFDYVKLICTNNDCYIISDLIITNSTYSLNNVEPNCGEFIFTLYTVDKNGNTSTAKGINIIPNAYPVVQSIELSRYHLAYNDSDQTIIAIAKIKNANLIDDDTVVKFQIINSNGSIINTIATLDKSIGIATATLKAPSSSSNLSVSGETYTVLCKIDDENADTNNIARFNVSTDSALNILAQSVNGLSYSTDKVQFNLADISADTTTTLRIKGYNLDLTNISVQLYNSLGVAYYENPVVVDTSEIEWTASSGENYQTLYIELPIPIVADIYTIKVLFNGIPEENYISTLQIYDVPTFISFDIPLVSVTKENNVVTAKIMGRNFDTPGMDLCKLTATCTNQYVVSVTSFTIVNDSVLNATFSIPGTVGEYDITMAYGINSITGTLRVQDFSQWTVGDVLLNDGTVIHYKEHYDFTETQKQNVIGVMYGFNEYDVPAGWLGVYNSYGGKNSGSYMWAPGITTGYNTNFEGIICTPSSSGFGAASTSFFSGDMDGSDNWTYICSFDLKGTSDAAVNYPALNYVNNYATIFCLTGDYATGWYMPSIAELCFIYRNKEILNYILSALDAIQIYEDAYWSASQNANLGNCAWGVYFDDDGYLVSFNKETCMRVCCVRAFE